MMCFAFNPEVLPVPTQDTSTPSLGGTGDPPAVLGGGGHAWDWISDRSASLSALQGAPGHHHSEDQSLELPVAARLCFFAKD